MNISAQSIIGEVVAENYRTAATFKEYGIDYCCNGDRTIEEACDQGKVELSILLEKLQKSEGPKAENDYRSWPLDLLADYIEKVHHRYVDQKIKEISPLLDKIVEVHGTKHPELATVQQLFAETAGELTTHMKKEEFILFPFVRRMVTRENSTSPVFSTVKNPIAMMEYEHDTEGERFRKISELTGGYTPPADACNTYRVTLALLKEFEEDLHLHIHLENNILFPKAIALEKELYG